LIYFYPMESPLLNKMEIFGELINLVLMYHLLLFTDFIQDVNLRYNVGYSFIFFSLFFITVHLCLMLKGTIIKGKGCLKEKCNKKKKKKETAFVKMVR